MSKARTEFSTDYIPGEDITIVWQHLYFGDEYVQRTVVGWYHGEPDEASTKTFSHLGVMGQYLWDDELDVPKPDKFKVLNYEYLNTGGNTMVGIFTVWLPDKNRTAYVLANEEGANLTTVDYISNELPIDDYDSVIIDHCVYEFLHGDEEYFELWRYCLNEYTKSDCRHFHHNYAWPYHLLSDELKSELHHEYREWCNENNNGCIPTDGYSIVVHPDYDGTVDRQLREYEDFKAFHDTTAGMEAYYNEQYVLSFAGRTICMPFMAHIWDAVDNLLCTAIEEY